MDGIGARPLITSLDESGNNYSCWARKARLYLDAKNLWKEVESETALNVQENAKAKMFIGLHVHDVHTNEVAKAATAHAAWQALEIAFGQKGEMRAIQLHAELAALAKKEGEAIATYINRGVELRDELITAGETMSERQLVVQILNGLPTTFQVATEAIMQSILNGVAITPVQLIARLSMAESRMAATVATPAEPAAFAARGQRPAPECWYCHKTGHIKRNCHKWKADQKRMRDDADGQGSNYGFGHLGVALMAKEEAIENILAANVAALDSGATHHMSGARDRMTEYRPLKQPMKIQYGRGVGHAVGVGRIQLTPDLHLNEVLHVADFNYTLLSVPVMTSKGADVSFGHDNAQVKLRGRVMLTATMVHGLYLVGLDGQTPRELRETVGGGAGTAMVATAAETPHLLHRRLAHLSYSNLGKMARHGMVDGMSITADQFNKSKPSTCEPCIKSSHARDPFPDSITETTRRLEIISTDLAGPMQVDSIGGAKYYITFLDHYSGLSVLQPIRSKADAAAVTIDTLNKLENMCGEKVGTLRSDRGGEYQSMALKDYFREKGIVHELTAPGTPQQNGKAERLNRTLEQKASAMLLDTGILEVKQHPHILVVDQSERRTWGRHFWLARSINMGHLSHARPVAMACGLAVEGVQILRRKALGARCRGTKGPKPFRNPPETVIAGPLQRDHQRCR